MIGRIALAVCVLSITALAAPKTLSFEHVTVSYEGITEAQATSLARVADAARTSAVDRFGFDVPAMIHINVDCRLGNTVRLFTDGNDTYTLSVRTGFDLGPPGLCGIYNLYGMCHELGHVVMYRPLKHRRWLTSDAAEGWAHYFGSRVVDDVWSAAGEKIWWMPYDYHAEGMDRLTTALQQGGADKTTVAAGMWMELATIVGEKKMPAVFAAWNAAKIDAITPAGTILAELKRVSPDNDARLDAWWRKAQPVIVFSVPRSTFAAAPASSKSSTAPASKGPSELAVDDGKSAGKQSIAGSGHAVAFEAPGDGYVLSAVKIYGSRYGAADPPAEDFHVYLCDEEGKQIADLPFPYKSFARGGQRWVTLKVPEKAVPRHFILWVSFDPTATKGVYVHYDKDLNGDSRVGLPGQLNDAFEKGDWMIRAVVAPAK